MARQLSSGRLHELRKKTKEIASRQGARRITIPGGGRVRSIESPDGRDIADLARMIDEILEHLAEPVVR